MTRREIAAIIAVCLLTAFAAWFYVKGRAAGQQTAAKTVETVVTKTVAVADAAQIKQLKLQLAAAKEESAAFQSKLQEAARANPAPDACRLPVGLRDDLNR